MNRTRKTTKDAFNGQFDNIRMGDTIVLFDGFQSVTGKVYGKSIGRGGSVELVQQPWLSARYAKGSQAQVNRSSKRACGEVGQAAN